MGICGELFYGLAWLGVWNGKELGQTQGSGFDAGTGIFGLLLGLGMVNAGNLYHGSISLYCLCKLFKEPDNLLTTCSHRWFFWFYILNGETSCWQYCLPIMLLFSLFQPYAWAVSFVAASITNSMICSFVIYIFFKCGRRHCRYSFNCQHCPLVGSK